MKLLRIVVPALVLLGMAGALGAATLEMANFAPKDAQAVIETDNAAGLRQTLLDSRFWKALEQTEGFKEWRASQRYAEMQQRLEQFLANLEMSREQALKAYLGGRGAVVLLPSGDVKKPWGVILTECTFDNAKRLVDASGAQEATKYRGVTIYEVQKENRLDRMAFVRQEGQAAVFAATSADGDALERVLDAITASAPSLGIEGHFKEAVDKLPAGWRIRAFAAEVPPRKSPGAVAMYPSASAMHFEWRIVSGQGDISMTAPVVLTAPAALPPTAVAAFASSFHPAAIWKVVKAKAAEQGEAALEKLRRGEMFVRGWFPGQTTDQIVGAFGPEAAMALLKGDGGGPPAILSMTRIADNGAAANSFKNGLAAKAMLLSALSEQNTNTPKLNVHEETHKGVNLLIIEAPGVLEKMAGDWAKDIALTVAVTDKWLIVGTTPAGVKATIDAASGGPSLAADAKDAVPKEAATRWGIVQPASGADIVLSIVEKFAGKATVDQARKLTNLAEVMKLVKRFVWTRVDEPTVIRGQADVQAIE
ncbi:MAG: hypothetical protein NTU94_01015 [Planctomycetota bacterium]|nr:hypothetical protein [Planctomycetota bacterium]